MDYITLQKNIQFINDKFEYLLANKLNIIKVVSPLFLEKKLGLTDELNGIDKAVSFDIKHENIKCEINQSLAKWKRIVIQKYGFELNAGLFASMNAIRKDEILDDIHSIYVDQIDWEVHIPKEDRTLATLKKYASKIYESIIQLKILIEYELGIDELKNFPKELFIITTQELEDMMPNKSPKERENTICEKHKAVFLMGIGHKLKSGIKHDDRSPDYDDWNLNGDILFWNNVLKKCFEISSMGIRVDNLALKKQLLISSNESKLKYPYHQEIINNNLPFTIGGGIGKSRLSMILLGKEHIGEVQVSVWPEDMKEKLKKKGINIL